MVSSMYAQIDENVVTRLTDILGESGVVISEGDRAEYSTDETPHLKFLPEVVVKPATVEEVAEVMRVAN